MLWMCSDLMKLWWQRGIFNAQWMITVQIHQTGRGWPGLFSAFDGGSQGGIWCTYMVTNTLSVRAMVSCILIKKIKGVHSLNRKRFLKRNTVVSCFIKDHRPFSVDRGRKTRIGWLKWSWTPSTIGFILLGTQTFESGFVAFLPVVAKHHQSIMTIATLRDLFG